MSNKIYLDYQATTPVDEKILKARQKSIQKRKNNFGSGALWKFSQTVGSARFGAVTHPGAKKEIKNYSDIEINPDWYMI